jgi:hypothetical protein
MNKRKYIVSFSIACLALGACKKSAFVETNLNPTTLYTVDPADQFLAAAAGCQDDFEYFYDVFRSENNWLQYTTSPAGNTPGFARVTGNFNERYSKIFYGRVGTYLSDIPHLVSQMKAGDQAKRVYQVNIAAIFKAYYAFYIMPFMYRISMAIFLILRPSRPVMEEHLPRFTTARLRCSIPWMHR